MFAHNPSCWFVWLLGCTVCAYVPACLLLCSLLLAAEPIIAEAEAALNSLDKGSLGELKSFGSPAAEIVQVGCTPENIFLLGADYSFS